MESNGSKNISSTILKAWLVAGTLDITIACVQYYLKTGKDFLIVPKFVAGGIFGKEAFTGGNDMIIAGFLFHYVIALIWTILFFFLYPRITLMRKNIIATAVLYGAFVWLIMNKVVMPLSALPPSHPDLKQSLIAMLILIVAIGFPVSLFAKKYFSVQRR